MKSAWEEAPQFLLPCYDRKGFIKQKNRVVNDHWSSSLQHSGNEQVFQKKLRRHAVVCSKMLFAQRLGTWSDKALGHFGGSLIVPQSSVCTAHQIHPTDIRGLHQKGDNGKVWYRALQSAGVGVLANDIRNAVRKKTGLCGKKSQRGGRGLTQTHSIFFSVFSNSGAYKMAKKTVKKM